LDLFKREGDSKLKISSKILKFFKAYDLSRDSKIEDMQKRLDLQKKSNMRMKNMLAVGNSEKSEVENLFLDCVDECKKDILRKKTLNSNYTS
jgi:hypothetical protein